MVVRMEGCIHQFYRKWLSNYQRFHKNNELIQAKSTGLFNNKVKVQLIETFHR